MLNIETITVTDFDQNCRVLWCSNTKKGVIVDPGGESDRILARVKQLGIEVKSIWLTHSHLDHCGAVAPLLAELKATLVAHPNEQAMRSNVKGVAQMYGFAPQDWFNCPEPDLAVQGGEELSVGESKCRVLFTPGHSPGHVSFYFPDDAALASGDLLFAGSVGRTDLPGGNTQTLLDSIRTQVAPLPGATRVLCGHGDDTTIARELATNPFLGGLRHV